MLLVLLFGWVGCGEIFCDFFWDFFFLEVVIIEVLVIFRGLGIVFMGFFFKIVLVFILSMFFIGK